MPLQARVMRGYFDEKCNEQAVVPTNGRTCRTDASRHDGSSDASRYDGSSDASRYDGSS